MENVHPVLKTLIEAAPFFGQMRENGFMIGITDREKTLSYFPNKVIDLKIQPNQMLLSDDPMIKVMKTGEPLQVKVPADLYGIPFKAMYIPIGDENNKTVGGLALGYELEVEEKVITLTEKLKESVDQILNSVDSFSENTQKQQSISQTLVTTVSTAAEKYNETDKILNLIKNISSQTNLLSLNAQIEAARVGEVGKGFAVVANEVQKLGNSSKNAANEISAILSDIVKANEMMKEYIKNNNLIADGQSSAIEEILAEIQEVNASVTNLNQMASKL